MSRPSPPAADAGVAGRSAPKALPAAGASGPAEDRPAPSSRAARRWPADEPEELAAQLRHQLGGLEAVAAPADSQDALRLVTAYLKHAQALAWRAVGRGDLQAPRRLLDSLLTVHPFLDALLPNLEAPAQAAVEIQATLQAFYVATEALVEIRTEARLADRERSATELAVMRVLAANTHRYLRRGQIHELLDLEEGKKPTVARVGQILARLDDEGQLVRLYGTAQGNPETAFYALSALGRETAFYTLSEPGRATWVIGVGKAEDLRAVGTFQKLVAAATDPGGDEVKRRVAIGALAATCFGRPSEVPIGALLMTARESQETPAGNDAQALCRSAIVSGILASRVGEREASGRVTFRFHPNRWKIVFDRKLSEVLAAEASAPRTTTGPVRSSHSREPGAAAGQSDLRDLEALAGFASSGHPQFFAAPG